MDPSAAPPLHETIVIGAGAAGLGVGAALKRAGVDVLILERADRIGSSWRGRYDRLTLNTVRWLSDLPYYRFERRYGLFPSKEETAAYLERYASKLELPVRTGIAVESIRRTANGWELRTTRGSYRAGHVVIATGYDREPTIPGWLGATSFRPPLLHASDYRNAQQFAGRRVLVIGSGNTATEIATDLAQGGALRVWIAMRTRPNIFPRLWLGMPLQVSAIALGSLPRPVVDRIGLVLQRIIWGDLKRYGLPRTGEGVGTHFRRTGIGPVVDGGFVSELKAGRIAVVGGVERLEGDAVVLSGGSTVRPDAVIAATGYARGLEPLLGELGVLDAHGVPLVHGGATHSNAPGLYFAGFVTSIAGQLRFIPAQARAIARAIRRESA